MSFTPDTVQAPGAVPWASVPTVRRRSRAYRASGRTTPIMDELSVHPYPNPSSPTDGPDVGYPNPDRFGMPIAFSGLAAAAVAGFLLLLALMPETKPPPE